MLEFLKRRITLRNKLLVFILLPAVVVIFWTMDNNTKVINRNLVEMIESSGMEQAKSTSNLVDNWLDTQENELIVMSQMLDLDKNWNQNQEEIDSLLNRLGKVDNATTTQQKAGDKAKDAILLIDTKGSAWSLDNEKTLNLSDRKYFKNAKEEMNFVISDPIKSRLDGQSIIVMITPLTDQDNRLIGFLGQAIPLEKLAAEIRGLKVGETGYGYLVDQRGNIFAHPSSNGVNILDNDRNSQGLLEIGRRMIAGEEGFGRYTFKGEEKYVFYHPIKRVGWSLALTVPRSEMLSISDRLVAESSKGYFMLIIIIFVVVFLVTTFVSRTINRISRVLSKVAKGDMTEKVKSRGMDEIGRMAEDLNETIDSLSTLINRIKEAAIIIANSSDEIAEGNDELSQRTQNNASSLEEISATIEEISASMQLVADNSEEANKLSEETMEVIDQGAQVVEETIEAMDEVNQYSEKISEIIVTVNEIASQTNLLALNAAVEAARANENGKGFAVVADEVRNLAERTGKSASEIAKLITNIIKKIEEGNQLIGETGDTLNKIIDNSSKVHNSIVNISNSAGEQAAAIEQTQDALEDINQGTQDNAAMVEEIASSSEELNDKAMEMTKTISKFKVNDKEQKNKELIAFLKDKFDSESKSMSKKEKQKFLKEQDINLDEIDNLDIDF
ncbi:methyl-accepting chemotaxis protein [Orenia marismortui]|uniref:methyl-accepting chemotaxis protein n=1 Tax=Orenia marismortui TaxID=46469 RepID=UPI0003750178|nr:methyl-accepting chemotaxis protein [Orenia marismortui]